MRSAPAALRFGLAFVAGLLMAVLLFVLMLRMVSPPKPDVPDDPLTIASFAPMDDNSAEKASSRSRQSAPEPPRPQQPNPSPTPSPTPATPQASLPTLDLELPTIDAGVSVSAAPTPSLDGLEAGQPNAGGSPASGSLGMEGGPAGGAPGGGPEQEVRPLNDIRPNYPRRALQRGIEGYVKLAFTINPQGEVENVRVLESSPSGVFDRESRRAAVRWRFAPRTQGGAAVAREAVKTLHFRLQKGR